MLVSTAFAQAAGDAAGGASPIMQFVPLILIFVVFYFLLIRPQQKKAKEHQSLLESIKRGDKVVTGGGIIGLVTKAADDELTVEIAENVRVKVDRRMVANVLNRTEPAANDSGSASGGDNKAGGLKGLLGGGKK